MKIDTSVKFKTVDGNQAADAPTLRELAVRALVETLLVPSRDPRERPAPENLDGKEKFELAQLAQKLHSGVVVDLKTEEIAKIKERIGLAYGQAVVFFAWNALEKGASGEGG